MVEPIRTPIIAMVQNSMTSAGVRVTPVLSMLHQYAKSFKTRPAFWVHGVRSGDHHAFRGNSEGATGSFSRQCVFSCCILEAT